MTNWFSETFSSEASENDIIKSRSLNITRITGVLVPILLGISTAIAELANKAPWNEEAFQRNLVFVLVGLLAVVSASDIISRGIVAAAAHSKAPVGTPLPFKIVARKEIPGAADEPGKIVGFRNPNADLVAKSGEYLFVSDSTNEAEWVSAASIHL